MNPDFINSRWWSGAVNHLAMAHFAFDYGYDQTYVWYQLLSWVECLDNLQEEQ
jgi:hypothetical protein